MISVHCSKEDAQYLKSVLVEASNQDILRKGLFIPTGLHLIEGKEVVTNLLREQEEFIKLVTSVQIEGISVKEMYRNEDNLKTTEQIIIEGPGVNAVERTYQTNTKGHWLVVVDTEKLDLFREYILANTARIYRNKKNLKW